MKHLLFLTCTLLLVQFTFGQGKVIEEKKIRSNILKKEVRYAVYLPPDYQRSEKTYPVIYLLHGFTDDQTGWVQFGEIDRLADKAIRQGKIPPMVIVMPDADSSFYINSYDGRENYEDFFIKEFMPAVEKEFRIKAEKRYRGVAGLSMGGYGSMIYALKYPNLFSAAAPLSAAIWDDATLSGMPDANYGNVLGRLYGRGLKGEQRLNDAWYNNSVLKLVETKSAESLKQVRYWIDCGDDDFLTKGNSLLHIAMVDKGIPHEYRVRDGAHTWTYWRTGIIPALAFIGKSFRQ
ncbi:MAG: alpha/beta hydrolase [Flavisolibacter sp.]